MTGKWMNDWTKNFTGSSSQSIRLGLNRVQIALITAGQNAAVGCVRKQQIKTNSQQNTIILDGSPNDACSTDLTACLKTFKELPYYGESIPAANANWHE